MILGGASAVAVPGAGEGVATAARPGDSRAAPGSVPPGLGQLTAPCPTVWLWWSCGPAVAPPPKKTAPGWQASARPQARGAQPRGPPTGEAEEQRGWGPPAHPQRHEEGSSEEETKELAPNQRTGDPSPGGLQQPCSVSCRPSGGPHSLPDPVRWAPAPHSPSCPAWPSTMKGPSEMQPTPGSRAGPSQPMWTAGGRPSRPG